MRGNEFLKDGFIGLLCTSGVLLLFACRPEQPPPRLAGAAGVSPQVFVLTGMNALGGPRLSQWKSVSGDHNGISFQYVMEALGSVERKLTREEEEEFTNLVERLVAVLPKNAITVLRTWVPAIDVEVPLIVAIRTPGENWQYIILTWAVWGWFRLEEDEARGVLSDRVRRLLDFLRGLHKESSDRLLCGSRPFQSFPRPNKFHLEMLTTIRSLLKEKELACLDNRVRHFLTYYVYEALLLHDGIQASALDDIPCQETREELRYYQGLLEKARTEKGK